MSVEQEETRDGYDRAKLPSNPTVLVVRPDSPWKSLKDLVEAAKKNPGGIKASVPGLGTMPHLALEILVQATWAAWGLTPSPGTSGSPSAS